MAAPRTVARSLRRTAAAVAKITDTAVADAATFAVEEAIGAGGGFRGRGRGSRPLSARVVDVSNRAGTSTATVVGDTAGAWSIKSYGRTGGYIVRPSSRNRRRALDLRLAPQRVDGRRVTALRSVRPRSTSGDDRWNRRVVDPTRTEFGVIVDRLVDDAIATG